MSHRRFRDLWRSPAFGGGLGLLWLAGICHAAPDLPEAARRALEANARALSPITIDWVRTRTGDPKAGVTRVDRAPFRTLFEWDGGRFHTYYWRSVNKATRVAKGKYTTTNELEQFEQEQSSDGDHFYNGSPHRDVDSVIGLDTVARIAKVSPGMIMFDDDYLLEAGYVFPSRARDFAGGRRPTPLLLDLLARGGRVTEAGRGEAGGAACEVVAVAAADGKTTRFYLDPAMNYAVRRRTELSRTGAVEADSRGDDFKKASRSDLWLPLRVRVERYAWGDGKDRKVAETPLARESYRVTVMSDDPIPPARFVLKYDRPGTFVSDRTLPGAASKPGGSILYRVPASPGDLDEVIKAAMDDGYTPKRRVTALGLMVLNAVLVTLAVAWLLTRRYRRPGPRPKAG